MLVDSVGADSHFSLSPLFLGMIHQFFYVIIFFKSGEEEEKKIKDLQNPKLPDEEHKKLKEIIQKEKDEFIKQQVMV